MKHVKISDEVVFGNDLPFVLIAGPCAMESRDHALFMAESLKRLTDALRIPFVFKTSFDKANRTSLGSGRGAGLDYALSVFDKIRATFNCPIVTDIHLPDQAALVAPHVDMLQIPAFLARQTDLLVAAAKTGKPINVKKPQWSAPQDMRSTLGKLRMSGNESILLCERGTSFGYNNFIVDMRSIPWMSALDAPVVIDATHGIQQPASSGCVSGGDRRLAPVIARAALAIGVAGVFIETHENPDAAPCDGPNMIKLSDMENNLRIWKDLDAVAKANLIEL
ncbi:MAG: 3-deoxy-8-phosphooctulonate synthase [Alphaproteobacteria bacterium]|nr:3-deoxy-8-phosphooctulonate synthase [Alphaproteobacteria bacterium]